MFKKENIRRVFGFRSGKGWKSIVAAVYMLFCLVFLYYALTSEPVVACDRYDETIYRISSLVIFLGLISPFILLSETPLRDSLPFFSKRSALDSLLGMMIVALLCILFFIGTESYHTAAYRESFSAYIEAVYDQFYNVGVGD
jgi:hypothetical protein